MCVEIILSFFLIFSPYWHYVRWSKKYAREDMKVDDTKEPLYYAEYNGEELA